MTPQDKEFENWARDELNTFFSIFPLYQEFEIFEIYLLLDERQISFDAYCEKDKKVTSFQFIKESGNNDLKSQLISCGRSINTNSTFDNSFVLKATAVCQKCQEIKKYFLIKGEPKHHKSQQKKYFITKVGEEPLLRSDVNLRLLHSQISISANFISSINKIFISHSSKDELLVKKFVNLILDNALGVEQSSIFCTSIEGLGIKTGNDFKKEIKNELINASMVLQFISNDYRKSKVCLNEMGAAWVLCDNVIPFVIGNKYDVGFIHKQNLQRMINSRNDLLSFIGENENLFLNKAPIVKITLDVDEFIKSQST